MDEKEPQPTPQEALEELSKIPLNRSLLTFIFNNPEDVESQIQSDAADGTAANSATYKPSKRDLNSEWRKRK